jgi:RND family efflux transporter MFP subunit
MEMLKRIISVFISGIILLGLTSCGKKEESLEVSSAINVKTVTAEEKSIENNISYTGEIKAASSASVSAKVSGTVKSIKAELGDYVNEGDVLMTIDSTQYAQTYNQALANVEMAEASKANADAQYRTVSEGSSEQTKININQSVINAETQYNNAKDNYDRQKALYDIGAISKVALDNAKTSLDTAKLAYDTALKNAELNNSVIIPRNEESAKGGVTQANASLKQARVALEIASTNLDNCVVRAPISGYITAKNVTMGQMASPGIELFGIKNSDMADVELNVTDSVISKITEDTKAVISVKSAGLKKIKGSVTVVSKAKNDQTGMFTVKVAIPNKDGKIKIGMLADVSLIVDKAKNALAIDNNAIINKNGKNFVYIAKDGKAVKKEVEPGISNGEITEITKGLKKGDKVITDGKEFLSDKNNKIKIVK